MMRANAKRTLFFTSPQRGEVGERSSPGEGVLSITFIVAPHASPLPNGEKGKNRDRR